MEKRNFAFNKMNFILLAIGMAIIIIGFFLMSGPGTDVDHFEDAIFSVTRIKIAPVISLFGFVFIIYAVMYKPKNNEKREKE